MSVAGVGMVEVRNLCKGRRVEPAVLAPTPEQLTHFNAAQRETLTRLLTQPAEFMDHPVFHEPYAEQLLFDPPVCEEDAHDRDDRLGVGAEHLPFLQYNYARYRIARILKHYAQQRIPISKLRDLLEWAEKAVEARNVIVERNMPLVLAMIRRNRLLSLDISELISEGNLALLRCVNKFDCSRGNRFSTYACRSILKSFARVALRTSRYRSRFPCAFEPGLERSNFAEQCHTDAESTCLEEVRLILRENRAALSDVEWRVINARFLDAAAPRGQSPRTLEQIGCDMGVTKERVRQIQLKALRKLRLTLEDSLLRGRD